MGAKGLTDVHDLHVTFCNAQVVSHAENQYNIKGKLSSPVGCATVVQGNPCIDTRIPLQNYLKLIYHNRENSLLDVLQGDE